MARQWMKFFLDAGIPKESSAEYAVTFETNRMEMDMLAELNKDYLRDLNITALGDIISILRQQKKVLSKIGQRDTEALIKTEKKSSPPKKIEPRSSSTSSSSSDDNSSEKIIKRKRVVSSSQSSSVSSRLGPAVAPNPSTSTDGVSSRSRLGPVVTPSTSSDGVSSRLGPAVESGVFRRLGSQQAEEGKSPSKNVYDRLGPGSKVKQEDKEPQEQRISSTSENPSKTETKTKGILKKRGFGDGSSLSRSKSAPNIISLKPLANQGKLKKRISFGKDEIRLMEASPGIQARLGYGRCSSPPPPEIDDIDEPSLQTELKKIAVGKGQFEIRKVMKVVNEKLSKLRDSVTPERKTDIKESPNVPKKTGMKITMKNTEYNIKEDSNYKVDKVDLALRAAKLKSNLDLKREHETSSVPKDRLRINDREATVLPGKRLVKYETLGDGSRIKTYIDYDDPILETVPIKKMRLTGEEGRSGKKVLLNSDRMAEDFTVTRPLITRRLSDSTGSGTLAQRADMARTKHSVSSSKLRAAQSVSPEKSVKLRLDDGYKSDNGGRSGSVRNRIGVREVVSSGSSDKTIFSRLGSRL